MTLANTSNQNKKPLLSDMQIRFIIYTIALLALFFLVIYTPLVNKINISAAEGCYKKQDYVCAFKAYRKAFSTGINNKQYVEHYFQTLKKMKKIAIVQEELNNLLIYYPDSLVKSDIEKTFDDIRTNLLASMPYTYINNVVQGTNIIHWNNNDKLNVYIDKSMGENFPGYYFTEVQNAFEDYTKATNKLLEFNYVNNSADADIDVIFMEKISGEECNSIGNCSAVMGLTDNNISGSVLKKSTIRLRMKDLDNSNFTSNQIYNIVKHEIGHAIGISGHSYNQYDIMYPVSNDASWAKDSHSLIIERKEFSDTDINTIKLLYNIIPDVTNKPYNTALYPNMYMPIAVLGTKEQIAEQNLEESMRYASTVDANFVSKVNLAEGYFGSKDFERAKIAFKEALDYATTNDEKFTVYNNLAVIDYEENNYNEAIKNADLANSFSDTNEADEIKAYSYIELKQTKEAQKLLENLVKKHPTNSIYSAALFEIYIKHCNIIKAFAEMKRIKKENPDALNEPIYKHYSIFSVFL